MFDQSIWECNGHLIIGSQILKVFLCGVWNLRKEKFYPEDFSMKSFKQLCRETCVMAKRP